jgi:hypothetical protein
MRRRNRKVKSFDEGQTYITEQLTPEFISSLEDLLSFLQDTGHVEHLSTLKKMDALMTVVIAENKYLSEKMNDAMMSLMATTTQSVLKDPLKVRGGNEYN